MRLALGATRGRIVAQLLSESLLIGIVGLPAECCWRIGRSSSSWRSSRRIYVDLPEKRYPDASVTFFPVIGLRLVARRWLTDADVTASGSTKGVAMVNQEFVLEYFPNENPLGRRLLSGDEKENIEIGGVVADYRPMGAENGARPQMFRPSDDRGGHGQFFRRQIFTLAWMTLARRSRSASACRAMARIIRSANSTCFT